MARLDGKVAIVTGAAGGIGDATARLLAREGARVVATARSAASLQPMVAEITAEGFDIIALSHDVSREADWKAVTERAVEAFGTVDVLANVAGKADEDPFDTPETITEAEWDLILDTNTKSIFWSTKYVIPIMKQNGGGSIVNVGSLSSFLGSVSGFAYSASKGGVAGMTKDIAWHYGPHNIRCNSVHPGPTDTPMMGAALENPEIRANILGEIPLRRVCDPIQQAYGILYLASDESDFVTGTSLVIDGGYCIQ
ncbi:SDR family NAD(P)-dependent oxidoreductase [Herbiconiux daphne]|uniref:SDR family oxidoreductase n=1 Tax=Herbiconiux daphne TaxID=2970914 RepID=A0ABT2H3P1_9MICO|nr:SDR family oxidoreductase [Herbiconiux daphne]MCS5734556.1 SDR family oxidoreductase [Herbiconiux daphne]